MTTPYADDADFTAVAASDTLLDALATGASAPQDVDGVAGLFTAWRLELDEHERASTLAAPGPTPATPVGQRRWRDAHRRTAAVAAIVIAIAGSTGVAAAAGGNSGPLSGLHHLLFGHSKPPVDEVAAEARKILDRVGPRINAAAATGIIHAAQRDRLSNELAKAKALLNGDLDAPPALVDKLDSLSSTLAAIPAPPSATPPASESHGQESHGRPGSRTDDHSGRHPGSDDGTTRHGGSGSGSDDGTTDNSDQGSTAQGGDGQGSDDGSSTESGNQNDGSNTSGSDDNSVTDTDDGSAGSGGDNSDGGN